MAMGQYTTLARAGEGEYVEKRSRFIGVAAPVSTPEEAAELVAQIKEGLAAKGGYCPCRLQKTDDTKCICKEFREQMADPDFEGYCHCLLYYKSKD